MTDSTEDQVSSLVQIDDIGRAREAAWQDWENNRVPVTFDVGYRAGAEWGIAAERERVQALVRAAHQAVHHESIAKELPGGRYVTKRGWDALDAALRALESLGAPK